MTIEISDEDFSRAVPRPADETKYPKGVDRADQGFLVGRNRLSKLEERERRARRDLVRLFLMAKTAFFKENTDLKINAYKTEIQSSADQFFDDKQFKHKCASKKSIGENALSDTLAQLKLI